MASSLALTALNLNPYPRLSSPSSSRFSWSDSHRKSTIRIRTEIKVYKGTHMREQRLTEMIEQKVMEAKQVCGEDETSDECKVAWDEVEEISQAKADLRLKIHQLHQDPLQHFCQENPETEECRIYED